MVGIFSLSQSCFSFFRRLQVLLEIAGGFPQIMRRSGDYRDLLRFFQRKQRERFLLQEMEAQSCHPTQMIGQILIGVRTEDWSDLHVYFPLLVKDLSPSWEINLEKAIPFAIFQNNNFFRNSRFKSYRFAFGFKNDIFISFHHPVRVHFHGD